jgi:hypothetical protein
MLASYRTSTTGQQLMLNSDMSLIKNIFGGNAATNGQAGCTYDTCPATQSATIVEEYATNNTLFVKDFTRVFTKMLTKGYEICDLTVLPSKGSGPEIEQLYGIPALKSECIAAQPTTQGLFGPPSGSPAVTVLGPPRSAEDRSGNLQQAEPISGGAMARLYYPCPLYTIAMLASVIFT